MVKPHVKYIPTYQFGNTLHCSCAETAGDLGFSNFTHLSLEYVISISGYYSYLICGNTLILFLCVSETAGDLGFGNFTHRVCH